MKKIAIEGEVRLDWLVEQVADELGHDDLLWFIKGLDARAASYEFTVALRDYCVAAIAAEDTGEVLP